MYTCLIGTATDGAEVRHGAGRCDPPFSAPEGTTMREPPEPDKGQLDLFEWLVSGYSRLYDVHPQEHSVGMLARFEHSLDEWLTFSHLYDWESGEWHISIDSSGLETIHEYDDWNVPL